MNRLVNASVPIFLFVIFIIIVGYTSVDLHVGRGINKTFYGVEGWGTEKRYPPSTVNGSRPKALLSPERRVRSKRNKKCITSRKRRAKKNRMKKYCGGETLDQMHETVIILLYYILYRVIDASAEITSGVPIEISHGVIPIIILFVSEVTFRVRHYTRHILGGGILSVFRDR